MRYQRGGIPDKLELYVLNELLALGKVAHFIINQGLGHFLASRQYIPCRRIHSGLPGATKVAIRRNNSSEMFNGAASLASLTAPSAACASATITSILCEAFSFAIRQPRGLSIATLRCTAKRIAASG